MPTFGKRFVIPAAETLMNHHHGLRIEIDLTERLADPVLDRMDAVIRVGAMTDSSLIATKLGSQQIIMCASPDYVKGTKAPLCAGSLGEHRLLDKLHGADLLGWRKAMGVDASAIDNRVVFRCDDFEGLRDAACRGIGVARLASWIVLPDIRQGRLVSLSGPSAQRDEQGIYVLRALSKPSATYQAFVQELKGRLNAHDAPVPCLTGRKGTAVKNKRSQASR
jgi:DNA-binding transcriptional LysR family regulator